MAIPQPLADELKKAGLPEPDLHEYLRQNEEMWQLFYPEYYNNGKQLPPIEENRRQTQFTKGRGRKAAAPGPARGTKRQRTTEPTTQQVPMSTIIQAPSMPPPQQQQQVFENMQSHGTQQFFASFHSSGNHHHVENQTGTQTFHHPLVDQDTEDDHNDGAKKHRTGPVGYDEQEDFSMTNSAAASRGSLVQQLSHQQRGITSTRPSVPTHVDRRQQQVRAHQHEQVAQVVNPGWDHIVGTAVSNQLSRQAQSEAAMVNHELRQEVPVDVPSQRGQSLVDDEQWAGSSSSPFSGDFQGQSADLASGAVDEESSSIRRLDPYSSPIRYDLMAMPRVPIGRTQWQDKYSGPPMLHGAVGLRADDEVQHLPSSPPVAGSLAEEPENPQIPSSPPKTGLNDSGYFPGGLAQGNDGGSRTIFTRFS